jgi:hypothetical protein
VQTNRRNGVSRKTLKSEGGAFEIEVPRHREGSFEPRPIAKGRAWRWIMSSAARRSAWPQARGQLRLDDQDGAVLHQGVPMKQRIAPAPGCCGTGARVGIGGRGAGGVRPPPAPEAGFGVAPEATMCAERDLCKRCDGSGVGADGAAAAGGSARRPAALDLPAAGGERWHWRL